MFKVNCSLHHIRFRPLSQYYQPNIYFARLLAWYGWENPTCPAVFIAFMWHQNPCVIWENCVIFVHLVIEHQKLIPVW